MSPASPVCLRLALWLGCSILLGGFTACSWVPGRMTRPAVAPVWGPPVLREVGRIIDYDPAAGTAWFEVPAHLAVPGDLTGASLVVRHPDTLVQTARVVVSPHRAGRIFGVYVIEGRPALEEEVARLADTLP